MSRSKLEIVSPIQSVKSDSFPPFTIGICLIILNKYRESVSPPNITSVLALLQGRYPVDTEFLLPRCYQNPLSEYVIWSSISFAAS
jgi:hypothetical protein